MKRNRKPKSLKPCSLCGGNFLGWDKQDKCPECRNYRYAKKHTEEKPCRDCAMMFTPSRPDELYCSDECKRNFYNERHANVCKYCGKQFTRAERQDYCGLTCASKHTSWMSKNVHGVCVQCGHAFVGAESRRYCSEKCKRQFNMYNTKQWRYCSEMFREKNPACELCGEPTGHVHHKVKHNGNPRIFWDCSVWQALCVSCHSKLTAEGK